MDFSGMPDYGDRKNRCATCGFYALRAPGTNNITEASEANRSAGAPWGQARPDCAIGAANLYREVAAGRDKVELRQVPEADLWEQIKTVIEKERDGAHWFPWRPHFSPTWHVERSDMLQLEQSRRDFELRLHEMERESRQSAEQIQRDSLEIGKITQATMEGLREIAAQSEDSAARSDRFQKTWTKWAVGISITALFIVLAQYVFPDFGLHLGEWIDRMLGYPLGRT